MTPRIQLIARPSINWEAISNFLRSEDTSWNRTDGAQESEELIEFAGRICYLSFGKRQSPRTNIEYIRNLIDKGHESVLEHACWTFELSNITRSFTHQLVRHRVGFSFSQLSQQYVDHSDFEMHPAIDLKLFPNAEKAWAKAEESIRLAYQELKNALQEDLKEIVFKNVKERNRYINAVARQILPNATRTAIVVSANARALRHFLKVRGETQGDPEMRAVCSCLQRILMKEAPAIFSDFKIIEMSDGSEAVVQEEN